jgi:hypothetical protein
MHAKWRSERICGNCLGSGRAWDRKQIERHVEEYLRKEGKSYKWLADEMGLTKGHLHRMVKGKDNEWQVEQLRKLFSILFPNLETTECED